MPKSADSFLLTLFFSISLSLPSFILFFSHYLFLRFSFVLSSSDFTVLFCSQIFPVDIDSRVFRSKPLTFIPIHPICPCLAPGEPITQIGLYGRMMEAAPMHVLGNPIGNRNIAVSRCPNYATSFNYIHIVCLDSVRTRCIDILNFVVQQILRN